MTFSVVIVAPTSMTATVLPTPWPGSWSVRKAKAFSLAKDSTSMTRVSIPPVSQAALRISTFSLRQAASSTSTVSGFFSEGPSTSKSRLTSSSGYGTYWSASNSIWLSMSSSDMPAGMGIILEMTDEPAMATAACRVLVPDRFTARRMASPTASTSVIFFSTTELGGRGSTA